MLLSASRMVPHTGLEHVDDSPIGPFESVREFASSWIRASCLKSTHGAPHRSPVHSSDLYRCQYILIVRIDPPIYTNKSGIMGQSASKESVLKIAREKDTSYAPPLGPPEKVRTEICWTTSAEYPTGHRCEAPAASVLVKYVVHLSSCASVSSARC